MFILPFEYLACLLAVGMDMDLLEQLLNGADELIAGDIAFQNFAPFLKFQISRFFHEIQTTNIWDPLDDGFEFQQRFADIDIAHTQRQAVNDDK